jgi:O-antigen ligase
MAKSWYLFWPLLLVMGLRKLAPAGQERVLRAWLVAFAVLSVVGIQQYFTGWPRPQRIPNHAEYFHATLFLGHHLSVASIFIFPLFVTLDLALRPRALPRGFLIAAALLGTATLFLGYSRMLWVALPIGLLAWGLWALPRKWGVTAAILAGLAGLALFQHPEVQRRLHDAEGVSTREQLWRVNMEFVKARPLTGTGWHHNLETAAYYLQEKQPGGNYFVGHAHDNALEMLASTGAIGFLAWLFWCGLAVWLLWKNPRLGFSRGLMCAWLVFQINGLTQVNFWEAKVLHQLMWVMAWTLL